MRWLHFSLLTLLLLLPWVAPGAAHAHIGDQVYPFFELPDEDLERIDLTDGSVEDWLEVVGEPSVTASGFFWLFGAYDLSDLDFRIWLAWNESSGTLWVAMERFDDLYLNSYDGTGLHEMVGWDSSIAFMVDGDHTAGIYGELLGINCAECTAEQVLWNHRQAQRWMAIAEAPGGGDILDYDGAGDWVIREPYAAAGGGVIGESPATTVTEFMLTPFDDLIYNDEEGSTASELYPGKVIGFSISMWDYDGTGALDVKISLSGKWQEMINADLFSDGLLIGGAATHAHIGDEIYPYTVRNVTFENGENGNLGMGFALKTPRLPTGSRGARGGLGRRLRRCQTRP